MRSLLIVEALDAVIDWHDRQLVPLAGQLTGDARYRFVLDDFFAAMAGGTGFAAETSPRPHAILVDIDHTPRHLLHPSHAPFYEPDGLQRLADRLHPGGIFALWADGAPDDAFATVLEQVFASCRAHVVTFPNFYTGGESASTVYVARTPSVRAGR